MSDRTIDLLVGFEERFEAKGHRPVIAKLEPKEIGVSVLRCEWCDATAEIHTRKHGAWFLPDTPLDLGCPFPTTEHDQKEATP